MQSACRERECFLDSVAVEFPGIVAGLCVTDGGGDRIEDLVR